MRDESNYKWFRQGLESDYPICCILFFCFEWGTINKEISEYGNGMDGYIKCPHCLERQIYIRQSMRRIQ